MRDGGGAPDDPEERVDELMDASPVPEATGRICLDGWLRPRVE